jgi:Peptidase family M49
MKSLITMLLVFASTLTAAQTAPKLPDLAQLTRMAARFAPTPLVVDTSRLSSGDRQALVKLIEAARILNPIYMNQLWNGDLTLYHRLQADHSPLGRERLQYFWINKGPWSEVDGFTAFIPGIPARKPLGANFYPEDMTKAGFEDWVAKLPPGQQEQAKGFFTVIRQPGAKLVMVPYSEEYRADLEKCAALLREAAALTDNASLKTFLTSRAGAFLSNDYYPSDLAWMDLDSPLDITIGPYETYTDEMFGYKAAFEAYVGVRDQAESAKLAAFSRVLQQIEDHLPEDPEYRNPKLGASAPIRVMDEVIASGDGAHGITTAAYNLPNDERVVAQKGSKRVMLKNVQEAKFHTVLIPIALRMLTRQQQPDVSFEPFFTHILAHELMHGLGPQQITVNGRQTSPRKQLKNLFGAIEEAKADATGLWALQYMMDHAKDLHLTTVLHTGPAAERQLYTTFLASAFRSLRFGLSDAHGKGMAMQFNYIADRGGWVQRPDGAFAVNFMKIKDAVRDLTHDLLTVEATGDYGAAQKMLALAVLRPNVARQLEKLDAVPVDIEPQFVTANELAPEAGTRKAVAGHKGKSSNSRRKPRRRK